MSDALTDELDRHWLCLAFPMLALDGLDRRQSHTAAAARVVIDGPEQRAEVHLADARAQALGIRRGQRLAAAQALAPELQILRRDRLAERQMLEHLAAWAYGYTSRVCLDGEELLLELKGSVRLFGGHEALEQQLCSDLAALGFQARLGYGATPAAARVRAAVARRHPQRSACVYPLADVDLGDSALDSQTIATLAATGIRTLGELARLPRNGIARRFGQRTLDYLGRLHGQLPEALTPYRPPDSYHAWLELPAPCSSQEALAFPLRRMLGDLCAALAARDGGVQHYTLRFALESARQQDTGTGGNEVCRLEIGLLDASRDADHLYAITRARLERMSFPRPVLALHLEVPRLPRFVPRAADLFGAADDAAGWTPLIERLSARLGEQALLRPLWVADHRPEYASRWRAHAEGPPLIRPPDAAPAARRPLWLLPKPLPIHESAWVRVSGAERIESGWWDQDVRRDYYMAEVVDLRAIPPEALAMPADGTNGRTRYTPSPGARAWIYQDLRSGQWYLQGWFG